MIHSPKVHAFIKARTDKVIFHPSKMPMATNVDSRRQKSKGSTTIWINKNEFIKVSSIIGSGAYATVYSATLESNGKSDVELALKVCYVRYLLSSLTDTG